MLEELAVRTAQLHRALLPGAVAVLPGQKELAPRGRAVQLVGRRHVHVSDDREEPIFVLGGTGCFLLLNTGDQFTPSSQGLLTTAAYKIK